jgi:hypothetical protein
MSARYFFIAFAIVIVAGSARADDQRVKLTGYQSYTFGMREAELRERIHVRSEDAGLHGGMWLSTADHATVNGEDYELSFLIKDQALRQVHLYRKTGDDREQCEAKFRDSVELMVAEYGEPGDRRIKDFNAAGYIAGALFPFQDGGRIYVGNNWSMPDGCSQSFGYESAEDSHF